MFFKKAANVHRFKSPLRNIDLTCFLKHLVISACVQGLFLCYLSAWANTYFSAPSMSFLFMNMGISSHVSSRMLN